MTKTVPQLPLADGNPFFGVPCDSNIFSQRDLNIFVKDAARRLWVSLNRAILRLAPDAAGFPSRAEGDRKRRNEAKRLRCTCFAAIAFAAKQNFLL